MGLQWSESRNDFMNFLSESLESDEDNYRYNSILEAADEYADAEARMMKYQIQKKLQKAFKKYGRAYGNEYGGFAAEIAAIFEEEGVSTETEWGYSPKEDIAICTSCGYEHYLGTYRQYATNFCPNCGAKMKSIN